MTDDQHNETRALEALSVAHDALSALPRTRERSLAITKVEEAQHWLSATPAPTGQTLVDQVQRNVAQGVRSIVSDEIRRQVRPGGVIPR